MSRIIIFILRIKNNVAYGNDAMKDIDFPSSNYDHGTFWLDYRIDYSEKNRHFYKKMKVFCSFICIIQ